MRIIVGMSGGVDSSVAAYLLQQQGHIVEGLFMKNWEADDTDTYCSATEDEADARTVCDRLGIPLHTVNFSSDYWDRVFEYFLSEYRANRTPNPDILCNKEIKFNSFLNYALAMGADAIATGHYAQIHRSENFCALHKGLDQHKDQSYFLFRLNAYQLEHAYFPLGTYCKPEIRRIAEQQGFINHNKKDSTGICFIGTRDFNQFLSTYLTPIPGSIKTPEGKTLGTHQGLIYYTIGQRKGLGLGGQRGALAAPWYVVEKQADTNCLIVVQEESHPLLFKQHLVCEQLHWITGAMPDQAFECGAKTRYRQSDQLCTVTPLTETGTCSVTFAEPQRAITPGQSIVFYEGSQCLGGGVIV